jgi:superfamily II DNA or RNA helicase
MEEAAGSLQQPQSPPEVGGAGPAPGAPPTWPRGQLVRVRGDRWRVESGQAFPECQLLRLAGIGRTNRGRRVALLCPFDRPQRLDLSAGLRRIGRRRWLHAFRALVAGATPYGRLRTASAARIDLHAYQLEPALAVLNGHATRLLIADEVGLGKTIQAGLIVSELRAREQAVRTLILTPAGLRDQWAWELRERFSIDATVVDAALLRRTLAQIAAGTNPWSIWPVIIASLDFVKRPDVLRALDPFTWDALLVDEAHLCASAPERSAAVRRLASRARRVVLLTATPHAGDDRAFAALCRIGQIGPAHTILMFRRARPDVGLARNRRVRLLRVRCSEDERRMHRLLERYTRAVWTSADATSDARLAMIVLRKRALSSAVSLARSLERRLEALFDVRPPGTQLSLPFAGDAEPDEQTPEDDEPVGDLAAPGMEGRREREWLDCVLDAARRAAQHESKVARLSRLLVRAHEPAVIFTEYRDTARWLTAALQTLGPVVLLHGGLSRIERQDVERQFRTGAANLLVATDAAGEGLNLHHRCRLVVNLELPWNPMRLEQRIGRVDRLGQARRPHAIHLVARATAEEHIVRRLVVRQERARLSVGGINDAVGAPREEDVAAAVMEDEKVRHRSEDRRSHRQDSLCGTSGLQPGGRMEKPPDPFSTIDLRELAVDEVNRLRFTRDVATFTCGPAGFGTPPRLCSGSRPVDSFGACLTVLPRRRAHHCGLTSRLLCVFIVRLMDAQGDGLDESIVALRLDPTRPPIDISRPVLAALVRSHVLKGHALATRSRQLESAVALHQQVIAAAIEREHALAAIERHSSSPLQPGMFDRRALLEAERERAERQSRESERSERLFVLDAGASRSLVAQAELALVLLINQ